MVNVWDRKMVFELDLSMVLQWDLLMVNVWDRKMVFESDPSMVDKLDLRMVNSLDLLMVPKSDTLTEFDWELMMVSLWVLPTVMNPGWDLMVPKRDLENHSHLSFLFFL